MNRIKLTNLTNSVKKVAWVDESFMVVYHGQTFSNGLKTKLGSNQVKLIIDNVDQSNKLSPDMNIIVSSGVTAQIVENAHGLLLRIFFQAEEHHTELDIVVSSENEIIVTRR